MKKGNILDFHSYLSIEKREKDFLDIDQLKVVGFKVEKRWKDMYYFGKFMIDIGDSSESRIIYKNIISIEVEVIEYDEYYIYIKDDNLLLNIFTKFKNRIGLDKLRKGRQTLLVEAYTSKDDLPPHYFFYGKVVGISNCMGMKFSEKFIIDRQNVREGAKIVTGFNTTLYLKSGFKYSSEFRLKYREILTKIRILSMENDKLNWYKLSAYKCFMYYAKKGDEKEGISSACRQMNVDAYKLNGDALFGLVLAFGSLEVKTIDGMIHFIDGFF